MPVVVGNVSIRTFATKSPVGPINGEKRSDSNNPPTLMKKLQNTSSYFQSSLLNSTGDKIVAPDIV